MNRAIDTKPAADHPDSWDYCVNFWEGAIDNDEDTALAVREINAVRRVRAADDVA